MRCFATPLLRRQSKLASMAPASIGLKGYLRKFASEDRKTYFGVLAKLIVPDVASGARETVTKIERVIVQAKA
jgi:hypothetical protein